LLGTRSSWAPGVPRLSQGKGMHPGCQHLQQASLEPCLPQHCFAPLWSRLEHAQMRPGQDRARKPRSMRAGVHGRSWPPCTGVCWACGYGHAALTAPGQLLLLACCRVHISGYSADQKKGITTLMEILGGLLQRLGWWDGGIGKRPAFQSASDWLARMLFPGGFMQLCLPKAFLHATHTHTYTHTRTPQVAK